MSKLLKRSLAILTIIILLSLYIIGLVGAFLDKEYSKNMILFSVMATTFIPVIVYMFQRFIRLGKSE
ncbi:hypothetical protein EDC19_2088 [Natranaerovirga hydrolytica]|uniref:Uncharacterized protein n=1 Tax=Natranaerovirga hydrolytica TaxID=680378 RepID=A0A4R1MI53_9FIRM|nr:hypothetical protein [Natranaerovirga hydrolytica]TCK92358.1 hypothetical protein EDC19_2088 [Natranaerovirga hydrolytica]